jgi:secondary thiamine-phosphate synthase enzyme
LVYSHNLEIATTASKQAVDITPRVAKVVSESGIEEGIVVVFAKHTTTGLFINEREGGLQRDVEGVLAKLVPAASGYHHDGIDDNAASHIQSVLLGASLAVPISGGELELGTWQSIFLAERDGPRTRTVAVKVMGERS